LSIVALCMEVGARLRVLLQTWLGLSCWTALPWGLGLGGDGSRTCSLLSLWSSCTRKGLFFFFFFLPTTFR